MEMNVIQPIFLSKCHSTYLSLHMNDGKEGARSFSRLQQGRAGGRGAPVADPRRLEDGARLEVAPTPAAARALPEITHSD